MNPGDKVKLPSGKTGTVIVPSGGDLLPNHVLVKLDGNRDRRWFLLNIVKLERGKTAAPRF